MLNCDACVTVHFIFTEPVTVCDGRRIFNVAFVSKDYVVINRLPPPNKLSGKACLSKH